MGARGLDKRGSFFKVKGRLGWDLPSQVAPFTWGACSIPQPQREACFLRLAWVLA
jgi:hypothetical protein